MKCLRKRTIVVIALLCLAAVQLQKQHFTGTRIRRVSSRIAFSKRHHSEGEHAPSGQNSTSLDDDSIGEALIVVAQPAVHNTEKQVTRPYIRESISSDFWKSPVLANAGVLLVHCTRVPVFEGYRKAFGVA